MSDKKTEASTALRDQILEILRETKEASTSDIIAALRKRFQVAAKSHDVNPIMYRENGGVVEIARKAAGGTPYWRIKTSVAPTLSSDLMFVTVSATCPEPGALLNGILQMLSIAGVTRVKCNPDTENGRLAARLAAETGMIVDGGSKTVADGGSKPAEASDSAEAAVDVEVGEQAPPDGDDASLEQPSDAKSKAPAKASAKASPSQVPPGAKGKAPAKAPAKAAARSAALA
jgi:hypothetical protein